MLHKHSEVFTQMTLQLFFFLKIDAKLYKSIKQQPRIDHAQSLKHDKNC